MNTIDSFSTMKKQNKAYNSHDKFRWDDFHGFIIHLNLMKSNEAIDYI